MMALAPSLAVLAMAVHATAVLVLLAAVGYRLRLALAPGAPHAPASAQPAPSTVTVQLPVFNEAAVVVRLIDAACALRWPRHLLSIQVLDDSTDETTALAAAAVSRHQRAGVDIQLLRGARQGFKAGALGRGLRSSQAEFVAVFDADFVPAPDVLERLVPHCQVSGVAMVQARWGHLNHGHNLLTRVQALMLDLHFGVDQRGRSALGAPFNFNGTAGVWRRAAIDDAGGWRSTTLTEDLELSYRAQLRGWRAVYLDDVSVAAELPATAAALRAQQHRWAKGSAQTLRALLVPVLLAPRPLTWKLHALAHLAGNCLWPAMVLAALTAPWAGSAATLLTADSTRLTRNIHLGCALGGLATLVGLCGIAAHRSGQPALRAMLLTPVLMALAAGLSVCAAVGVLSGLCGWESGFARTPKSGGDTLPRYRAASGGWPWLEGAISLCSAAAALALASRGWWAAAGYEALVASGAGWLALARQPGAKEAGRQLMMTPATTTARPAANATTETSSAAPPTAAASTGGA